MNTDALATYFVVIAAVALGFVFGVEATGRLATVWMDQHTSLLPQTINDAAWIRQAQQLRWAAVVVFGVGVVGATVVWVRGDGATPADR